MGQGEGEELEYEVDSQEDEYVNTNWRMKIEDSEVD